MHLASVLRISLALGVIFVAGSAFQQTFAEDPESPLLKLAETRFGAENITEADRKLFTEVALGIPVNYQTGDEDEDDLANADQWPDDRVLNADRIYWLCTDREARKYITHRGIAIVGARIESALELHDAVIPFPLYIEASFLGSPLNVSDANIRLLSLAGSYCHGINASGLTIKQWLNLSGVLQNSDEVSLFGAKIGTHLICQNAILKNEDGIALNADSIEVSGSVFLTNEFTSVGEVNFVLATIGGNFDCHGANFSNENGRALNADNIDVSGSVFLTNEFTSVGEVNFVLATIGGNLDCTGAKFGNEDGPALVADSATVSGSVLLKDAFTAKGEINFVLATIGGNLDCAGAKFSNEGAYTLVADSVKVSGNVFLIDGFTAKGGVRLNAATIEGNLFCTKSTLLSEDRIALSCVGARIDGTVRLADETKIVGEVNFSDASVSHYFTVLDLDLESELSLILRSAHVGTLLDQAKSWPEPEKLDIHGFTYDTIGGAAPKNAEARLDWISRQTESGAFDPQPYEQLAAVLRKAGLADDARAILIARDEHYRISWAEIGSRSWWTEGNASWISKAISPRLWWYTVFGPIISYGYHPWKAFWYGFLINIFGTCFFFAGRSILTPTADWAYKSDADRDDGNLNPNYPPLNPLIYSLDVFTPIIDLHQAKYYLPDPRKGCALLRCKRLHAGIFLRLYFWCHIVAGWILSTLLLAGLSGLISD